MFNTFKKCHRKFLSYIYNDGNNNDTFDIRELFIITSLLCIYYLFPDLLLFFLLVSFYSAL